MIVEKIPKRAGISLNAQHYQDILSQQPQVGWLQIGPEPYLGLGGAAHHYLEKISAIYPLSLHCRSLSVGSAESVNARHLEDIKLIIDRYTPAHYCEYLGWNRWQGIYFHQTLPIPYNTESLDQVSFNLRAVQNRLGRRILVKNPVRLIPLMDDCNEGLFFSELVRSSGCGMGLDLTNLYATCTNLGLDPFKELRSYPLAAVREIHLSALDQQPLDERNILLIDRPHDRISKPIWQLYKDALSLMPNAVATLIQWTQNVPPLSQLVEEAHKADAIMREMEISTASGGAP